MWTFQYKHGDRPLDGYTIQRAAGRGGFGEVYYAVSDSGREVALKVISGYEQIELRGISQCMNLKSPHLVTIFDVRQNAEGRWFVIMEFVSGANLRQLLDEAPAGLGTQKTAFFLREIAKGLTFLHECGIVHRDLKPANIFYENGYVKIGDYGLSKAIAPDQHSGQTVTVGTVHYMAPEIGAGKYDRSVDIYALGALVYEMLTGTVPHVGASPTEVLMKHLSAEPDYTNIPEPFGKVVRKAMAKDPSLRYQSVQEMVEDVFGAEHIRQSVSVFSPQDLSMIAEHAAKRIGGGSSGGGVGVATGSSAATREPAAAQPGQRRRFGNVFDDVFDKVFEASGWGQRASADASTKAASPATAPAPEAPPIPDRDPLSAGQRRTLAALLSLAAAVVGGAIGGANVDVGGAVFFILPCVWGLSLGTLLACKRLLPAMYSESVFVRKLVIGLLAGGLALVVTLPFLAAVGSHHAGVWRNGNETIGEIYLVAMLSMLVTWVILPVERIVQNNRRHRLNLGYVVAGGALGFVFSQMFGGTDATSAVAMTCGAAGMLMIQMLAPWNPREALANKAQYNAIKTATARHNWANQFSRVGTNLEQAATRLRVQVLGETPSAPPVPPIAPLSPSAPASIQNYWWRPTSSIGRWAWGILMVLTFAASIALWVAAGFSRNDSDLGVCTTLGFAAMFFSILALVRACTARFYGWWAYLIKPLLLVASGIGCVAMLALMGTSSHLNGTEMAFAWFFLTLFFGGGIVLLCIPGRYRIGAAPPPIPGTKPSSAPATDLDWQGTPPIEAARAHYGGTFLGIIAGMFLLAMLVAGAIYSFDIPGFIASGLADPSLAMHLQRDVFGTSEWPSFVQRMLFGIVVMLMLVSMSFLTLGRRHRGGMHIVRGLLGILTFFFAITILRGAFYSRIWLDMSTAGQLLPGQSLMLAINRVSAGAVVFASIVFMFGVLLIGWPAARIVAASAPARKRSGWLVFGVTMLVLLVLLMLAGLFVSVAVPTVQIRSSNDGATIVPAPQIRQFDPFFYGQSQFPQQNNWPGPTTQPRSGGGFGGGSRIIVTPPNRSPNPSLHKGPTTARSPSIPKVPILPTPAPAPTTVPSGVFEE